jgi:hypothetical protein
MVAERARRPGILSAALAALVLTLGACSKTPPPTAGVEPTIRLLSEPQYRNIIADVFGTEITYGGNFDPLVRTNGLLTVGTRSARITPAGLEQFDRMARAIAAQVTDETNREALVPCVPESAQGPDDQCAAQFFRRTGRLLFRHPLSPQELELPVAAAHSAAAELGDFYQGLSAALAGMLMSPEFLFSIETTEPDPDHPGKLRLDDYSRAARLSFFLWGTTPDDELLKAAERGELHGRGLARQVDRMLASPKLEGGMRAFFNDMLAFEDLSRLEKDSIIYPNFSAVVAEDAREQTLRTIIDELLVRDGDYRDLFTTRRTFMSGPLGRIYRVPVSRPNGGWVPFEFPADDPHAGIVTQVSFAALYSHPGRSSPTLRGRAIRESLLCQKIPDPPGNVDFSLFNDPNSPHRTARERLTAHRSAPSCAGCHKLMDPIGLALEKIDGAGQLRTEENGAPIDTSGELDGLKFTDAASLGQAIHDNPATPSCLVNRVFSYASGHAPQRDEKALLDFFQKEFAAAGYRLPELLRSVALSDALYAVSAPPLAPVRSAAVLSHKDDPT